MTFLVRTRQTGEGEGLARKDGRRRVEVRREDRPDVVGGDE